MTTNPAEPPPRTRILVVDDEPKNRELLRDLLEFNGYAVIEADDGMAALKQIETESCDVILLDVRMPRMGGLETCRRLKANPKTAHIPVLMITAMTEREERNQGIEAGANDYLTKPIDRQDVLLRVRNAAYSKSLHDRVQQDLTKLRDLEVLQDTLTHMIVHDMRSPLMVISWSYGLLLKEKHKLTSKQEEFIAMGQDCCDELVAMITSLLDVNRMESGQIPLRYTPLDLCDCARNASDSVAPQAQKKSVSITINGSAVTVNADRDLLHRVFVNLLGNAIKFSPEGGTIDIYITTTNSIVRTTVTDHGCGIPPQFHQTIFEKFGQVASGKNEQKHSWGLGLTFCRLAVEAHGGHIGIEAGASQGSTFWFTLPEGATGTDHEHL